MQQDTNIVRHIATQHVVFDTAAPKMLLRPVDSSMSAQVDTSDYLLLCNDSVFAPYAADSMETFRESMFVDNNIQGHGNEPQLRNNVPELDWMFFVIVALLSIISLYLNHIRFNLRDIFMSLFNQRVQGRVERENNVKTLSLIPMTGIYFASLAAVATQIVTSQLNLRLTIDEPLFYAALTGSLILFILLRGGLIRLIGNIFNDNNSVQLYLTSNHLFYFVGGMILTPMLLFVFFTDDNSTTALATATTFIAILLVVRLIRGVQLILTNSKTSKLYLFYYLCILEIVPILVMAKILIK